MVLQAQEEPFPDLQENTAETVCLWTASEAAAISRLLNEIKNAEKLMKNTEKELASMQKKHDKVRDWRAISRLQQKTEEDKAIAEK